MSLAEFDARANQLAQETAGKPVNLYDQDTAPRPFQGSTRPRGMCPTCGTERALNKDGTVRGHYRPHRCQEAGCVNGHHVPTRGLCSGGQHTEKPQVNS